MKDVMVEGGDRDNKVVQFEHPAALKVRAIPFNVVLDIHMCNFHGQTHTWVILSP